MAIRRSRSKYLSPSFYAFLNSSVHSPRCIRLYSLHSNKTCLTVWFSFLQIPLPSPIPGTFLWNKISQKSDFSRACLYHQRAQFFVRPKWSLTMPLLAEGSSLCNARPRVSVVHFDFHVITHLLISERRK